MSQEAGEKERGARGRKHHVFVPTIIKLALPYLVAPVRAHVPVGSQ